MFFLFPNKNLPSNQTIPQQSPKKGTSSKKSKLCFIVPENPKIYTNIQMCFFSCSQLTRKGGIFPPPNPADDKNSSLWKSSGNETSGSSNSCNRIKNSWLFLCGFCGEQMPVDYIVNKNIFNSNKCQLILCSHYF